MIFRQSMTSEYSKIESLPLGGQRITTLICGDAILRKMTNLKELNLSNNKIVEIQHLSDLKGLQSLTLSYNRIVETQNLSLPILTALNLDRNRIKKVVGLRGLKKLEELSLEGN
jgi:internalin A